MDVPSTSERTRAPRQDASNPKLPTNVRELTRPFDPTRPEAEGQYDAVVRRIQRVRARRARNDHERVELVRQFVENDLTIQTGPRAGAPLSLRERRERIQRLFDLAIEARHLSDEEQFAFRSLDKMNQALDRWARDTYGE